ncbi:hypothetical protein [Metamycoplasma buccale]|uniref:5'-methylthioadenosine/S-adenosylhomocysteine nucleosidase family protein n=1 Tax=Metamycoplasma buccale TaxID=55602 RepID=UPI00398E64A7
MILFVIAEKLESEMLLARVKVLKEIVIENTYNSFQNILLCQYQAKKFYIAHIGVGKVNSSIMLSYCLNNLKNIDLIINLGVVGSISNLKIGTSYSIKNAFYYDVDLTVLPNYSLGKLPYIDKCFNLSESIFDEKIVNISNQFKEANILTADKFFTKNDINKINENFSNISLVDMECTSLFHAAKFYNIPLLSIKTVSDNLGTNNSANQYKENLMKCKIEIMENALKILKEFK